MGMHKATVCTHFLMQLLQMEHAKTIFLPSVTVLLHELLISGEEREKQDTKKSVKRRDVGPATHNKFTLRTPQNKLATCTHSLRAVVGFFVFFQTSLSHGTLS